MAQIIPRGNNKWLVRIFLRRTAEAKKEFHNKVVHGTKKDAQKYARETETKRDLGTLDKPIIEDPTLNDFLDNWLIAFKQKTVRERTYAGYKYVLDRYVRPYLGKDKLSELTTLRIQGVYNELSDARLSPRTIAFAHSLIRDALNQAFLSRLIEYNPTLSTRRPPRKKKPIAVFTPEEAERFMKAAKSDRLGIVFWFALATGARPEEYLALQWPDLNLKRREVNINKSIWWPKGGAGKSKKSKPDPASERSTSTRPLHAPWQLTSGHRQQGTGVLVKNTKTTLSCLQQRSERHSASEIWPRDTWNRSWNEQKLKDR